jgi:hypothetical protein
MDAHLSNRPSLDALRHMPVSDVIALPAEHLALLQTDAREALQAAKQMQDWIEAAIALGYRQRAVSARATARKGMGTVRFQVGAARITVDLPKKVEWDQTRLAALSEQIRAGGEDPGQYVEVSFKVRERAYAAWPERIRAAFKPTRTVHTGRATYRVVILSEKALHYSPHAAGIISMRERL